MLKHLVGDHFGFDKAGGYGIDGDRAACKLNGKRLGRSDQARLGSRIVHLAAIADHARNRTDDNDAAGLAAANHRHYQRLHNVVKAREIRVDHAVPIFCRHGGKCAVAGNAGIGDDAVVSAVSFNIVGKLFLCLLAVTNVESKCTHFALCLFYERQGFSEFARGL